MALVPFALTSIGPATSGAATVSPSSDVVSALAGHWRCTSADGTTSRRSYAVLSATAAVGGGGSAVTRVAGGARAGGASTLTAASAGRIVYARRESVGDAGATYERMVEKPDGSLAIDAPEGTATASAAVATQSLRFSGLTAIPARAVETSEEAVGAASIHTANGGRALNSRARVDQSVVAAKPLQLSYTLQGSSLRRTAVAGSTIVSDERCSPDAGSSAIASSTCARANAPASTIHAVTPTAVQRTPSAVQLHVVLDDRGDVVGADVLSSPSAALNRAALAAAQDSRFAAEVRGCRAVASELTFTVNFLTAEQLQRAALNNGRETNL